MENLCKSPLFFMLLMLIFLCFGEFYEKKHMVVSVRVVFFATNGL